MDDIKALEKRRKQLRYRANHRGIREMDLILGRFADSYLGEFDAVQLDNFEALMEHNDRDLLQWFTAETDVPKHVDRALFDRICAYLVSSNLPGAHRQ